MADAKVKLKHDVEKLFSRGYNSMMVTDNFPPGPMNESSNTSSQDVLFPDHEILPSLEKQKNGGPHVIKRNCFDPRFIVEPVLFFMVMGNAFDILTNQSLMIHKVCRVNFNYSEEICNNYTAYRDVAHRVQYKVSDYSLVRGVLEKVPSVIISFFLGAYSDKRGRKFAMFLGIIGFILGNSINLVCSQFEQLPAEVMFLSSTLQGLTGAMTSTTIGIFGYVSDVSDSKTRLVHMARIDVTMATALSFGMVASGEIQKRWGFLPVYAGVIILETVGLLYAAFVLEEVNPPKDTSRFKCSCFVKELFRMEHIKDNFRTVFRRREDNLRIHILITIACLCILMIPFVGDSFVLLMFTQRKFAWTQADLSYYQAAGIVINIIGVFFLSYFILKKFQVNEMYLGMVGMLSIISKEVITALSVAPWMLYCASIFVFFQPLGISLLRALVSKMVDPNETGKLFSVCSSFEAMVPLLASTIYSQSYKVTQEILPGTPFLIAAALVFFALILHCFVTFYSRKPSKGVL